MHALTDMAIARQARRFAWAVAVILPLLVVAAYFPGIHGGFVFDDYPNIVDNTMLRVTDLHPTSWLAAAFSSDASSLQRPLSMLSFAANHYFTGLNPAAMKWTNVAVHALNALLVFGLIRELLAAAMPAQDRRRNDRVAAFVAAAWALHPINFLGVLYVVQRMESLAHIFVFGGLWLYLAGRRRQLQGRDGRMQMGLGLVGGTVLGVLCKETAALLPLYAWLLEICLPVLRTAPDRRRMRWLFCAVLWIPAIAALAWLWPRVTASGAFGTRDFNLAERLLTEGRVVLDYLRWTIAPHLRELTLYHDDYIVSRGWWSPSSTLFAALALALLAAMAWWLRGRRPLMALGLLWFLAAQAMTATIIPLELMFEHRNYFASLGVCLALADLLLLLPTDASAKRIGCLLAACAVIAFGAVTHLRAREWQDPLRGAASEAAKRPQSPRAAYALGRMLVIASDYQVDSPHFEPARRALERARALPNSGILAHSALLMLAARTGQPQEDAWWTDMQARLRDEPVGPQQVNALASLTRCARDGACPFPPRRMIETFQAALARRNPEVSNLYADYTLNVLRDPALAIRLFQSTVAMRPAVAQYRINLIMVLIHVGRIEEARREIAELRAMGALGQNEAAAQRLEQRIK
jgi:protein O-mannosyl-transferase